MRHLRQILLGLSLTANLALSVSAQELYFRNKPYKGPVSGSWDTIMVSLPETAKIFELGLREEAGVFLVGDSQAAGNGPGQVVVNGKVVGSTPGEGGPMVNLKELAGAAGLTYKPNRELGGIDVTKPVAKGGTAATGVSMYNTDSGEPIYINKDSAGDDIVLDTLAVKGKVTFVYLYHTSYGVKDYDALKDKVDPIAQIPGAVLFKVNAGRQSSPLSMRYPGTVPRLYIFDRHGRYRTKGGGHGISVASAKKMAEQLNKEP